MDAKEISDETLESITPAADDLLVIYDVSAGTTGKAPLEDIAPVVAENIDIADLPTVTPAIDDTLMIRDTSTGTTGKATLANIVQKGASSTNFALNTPLIKKQNNTDEGGQIDLESSDNADINGIVIDVYLNKLRIFATMNNELRMFTIDFENKTTYWN